ncbi:MAG: hypothetical protein DRR00_30295 [Candidatus Parabeggiatoa sp. nov. 3]|nr:MAG: hypothetical protein DRR00_30295 [Gammaproteobacteria bacterium]RKZ56321.1 MAG: hypothetical protein DRQ99_28695 [Gammaproteobacteria bacterium]
MREPKVGYAKYQRSITFLEKMVDKRVDWRAKFILLWAIFVPNLFCFLPRLITLFLGMRPILNYFNWWASGRLGFDVKLSSRPLSDPTLHLFMNSLNKLITDN